MLSRLLAAGVGLAACCQIVAAQGFVQAKEIWVDAGASRTAIFVNTHTGMGGQPNTWQRVDLKPFGVPADAMAVQVTGFLIITHGSTPETADLSVALRRPGAEAVSCANYQGQTVEAHVGGGQRSNMSTWVPVANGELEFCYRRSTQGQWPTSSAYGVNLSVQAWVR